jgi:hypothetical protein
MIGGLFIGLCGSYFLENNFRLLASVLFGIAGILVGAAVGALLDGNKVSGAPSPRIKKNAQQIKSGWDYRPRKAIRPYVGANSAGAETSEVLSPERFAINNNSG